MSDDPLEFLTDDERLDAKLAITNEAARSRHPDYDETVNGVMGKVKADETLSKHVLDSADPAETAYNMGKREDSLEAMFDDQEY